MLRPLQSVDGGRIRSLAPCAAVARLTIYPRGQHGGTGSVTVANMITILRFVLVPVVVYAC